jgi:hypothetical protein
MDSSFTDREVFAMISDNPKAWILLAVLVFMVVADRFFHREDLRRFLPALAFGLATYVFAENMNFDGAAQVLAGGFVFFGVRSLLEPAYSDGKKGD